MYIKKILLLASLILLFLSSSQAENSRIDYIVTYKDNIWYKTDYNYNSENKIINTTIAVSPDKNNWENYTYSTITYNNGAISEAYDYCWKNNTWDLQQTQIYEYTAKKLSTYTLINGDTKKVTTYQYNDTIHTEKHQLYFNNSLTSTNITTKKIKNNKIVYVKVATISPNNDTVFAQYTTIDYTDKEIISTTYEKKENKYLPTSKNIEYLYNNIIQCEIQSVYNENTWVYSAKKNYTYTQNGSISEITYQIWQNNFWLSLIKQHYDYNENNLLECNKIFEMIYKEWQLTYQLEYHYKNSEQLEYTNIFQTFWSENNKLYNDFFLVNIQNDTFYINANNTEFVYEEISTDVPLSISPINLYPNPSKSGIVFIDTDLIIHNIDIFDINGILLYQNKYIGHIDLSHFNNGMYIIQIKTDEGNFSFKQIVNNY